MENKKKHKNENKKMEKKFRHLQSTTISYEISFYFHF